MFTRTLQAVHSVHVGCYCICRLLTGSEAWACSAGMPEGQRRASIKAAQPETAAQAGLGFARPEEVSAFRMTRRKRASSVKAPTEAPSEKGPVAPAKAAEPIAPTPSLTDLSDEDVSSKPGVYVLLCSVYEQGQMRARICMPMVKRLSEPNSILRPKPCVCWPSA